MILFCISTVLFPVFYAFRIYIPHSALYPNPAHCITPAAPTYSR